MAVRFDGAKLLVVGDVLLDRYIWGRVERISPEAPVPVLLAQSNTAALGGAGNVAANAASLGGCVTLLGVYGRDPNKDRLDQLLQEQGIGNAIRCVDDVPTITKTRIMADQQQCIRIDEEKVTHVSAKDEAEILKTAEGLMDPGTVCILSDYGKGLLSASLCPALVEAAHRNGCRVLIDPKGQDWSRYRGADCITPNSKEFGEYCATVFEDEEQLRRTARKVCSDLGLSSLLVTRGPKGMLLAGRDFDAVSIPTRAKEVFDVSGAGDTVIATLGLCLGAGMDWLQAARTANVAAGIVVGKVGTQPVERVELEQALDHASERNPKIVTRGELAQQVRYWKQNGQTVVFTNGCFDLLHPGHIRLLQQAAAFGHRLVVGINADESVRRIKGQGRPVLGERERATILAALQCVDRVVVFFEDTPLPLLEELQPDVLVKGQDYLEHEVVGRESVLRSGGRVELVPIADSVSTTGIINHILQQK